MEFSSELESEAVGRRAELQRRHIPSGSRSRHAIGLIGTTELTLFDPRGRLLPCARLSRYDLAATIGRVSHGIDGEGPPV